MTGGQAVEISCGAAGTSLDYMDGDKHTRVVYNNLGGYFTVQESIPEDLSAPSNSVTGLNITLLRDGRAITELPAGSSVALYFDIPADLVGHQFKVLAWDAGQGTWVAGQGKWVELNATVQNGKVVVMVDSSSDVAFPTSFVLVDQSAAQDPYQSFVSFFTDLLHKLLKTFNS